jgi:hypothetical protein
MIISEIIESWYGVQWQQGSILISKHFAQKKSQINVQIFSHSTYIVPTLVE